MSERPVVRCPQSDCKCNQFLPANGLCRRCGKRLLPEPPAKPPRFTNPLSAGLPWQLRFLREARGFTQTTFAKACGLQRQYFCRLEHAHHVPGVAILGKIADALKVPIRLLYQHDEHTELRTRFAVLAEEQQREVLEKAKGMVSA